MNFNTFASTASTEEDANSHRSHGATTHSGADDTRCTVATPTPTSIHKHRRASCTRATRPAQGHKIIIEHTVGVDTNARRRPRHRLCDRRARRSSKRRRSTRDRASCGGCARCTLDTFEYTTTRTRQQQSPAWHCDRRQHDIRRGSYYCCDFDQHVAHGKRE